MDLHHHGPEDLCVGQDHGPAAVFLGAKIPPTTQKFKSKVMLRNLSKYVAVPENLLTEDPEPVWGCHRKPPVHYLVWVSGVRTSSTS